MRATKQSTVLIYRHLRAQAMPRPDAARLTGVSYRTAQRLDPPDRCARCGQPIEGGTPQDHKEH